MQGIWGISGSHGPDIGTIQLSMKSDFGPDGGYVIPLDAKKSSVESSLNVPHSPATFDMYELGAQISQ